MSTSILLLIFSSSFTGQFYRNGVVVDEVRKLLLIPNKAPVPVQWKSIGKYMERHYDNGEYCWASMNPGLQGKGLIEGDYLDYLVEDVLSSGFKFKASTE